ncbi:MAG: SMC-Scp complex subunit ScpB [Cellvibrio sp.]|jgi:segregation and condensation protein B|nr:SMC-Scp complex subunit ScpB [Cellvibrio sp.]MDF3012274.1 SMC-Scp complex subunit ScpB [Cellvibrio sp.]
MTNEIDINDDTLDGDLDSSVEVGEESPALHEESDTEESATVPVTQMPVDAELLRKIIEGAILAAGQPMTIARLLELFDEEVAPGKEEIAAALVEIQAASAGRGFELKEVASGWRFQVRDNLAPWVNRLWEEKPQKYSRALLETLALVAYRQPITRGDIEEIRGVAVSSHIMKTLLERDWVKVVGHRDVPGRPSLFATTRQFLDYFNLKSLDELPSLSEIRDLDELNPVLDLGEAGLGEKDTDPPIPDENPVLVADETDAAPVDAQAALYEDGFVDGEEAFVDADDVTVPPATATENDEEPRSD